MLLLAVFLVGAASFAQGVASAADRADADGDGWYSGRQNQRVSLTLVGLTSSREGDYGVMVGGGRFPYTEKNLEAVVHVRPGRMHALDCLAAGRVIGVWLRDAGDRPISWSTELTVIRSAVPPARGAATLSWTNRPCKQSVTVSLGPEEKIRLDFRVTVEPFGDPSPADRNADADRDGLLDWEEADYAMRGIELGDPGRKDLILAVGHTHADWRMTELTKTLLRTCFRRRGINLYLATSKRESLGLCRPGLVSLDDEAFARDHAITLAEARRIRAANLKEPMSNHAHFVVLAASVASDHGALWGRADLPGAALVVTSHLPMLGPDFHAYQAKTLLHELGHNLGLCHPDESGASCLSGPIPKAEQTSAMTVMGTSRADRGDPVALLRNAWSRPMDYSPTQWKNARLDWVRRENRPAK